MLKRILKDRKQDRSEGLTASPALWVMVGILLLGFGLRTRALGASELTFDEIASFSIAARGPIGLLDYLRGAVREHPPLYYFLLSLWMPIAGTSEFAVRFLSVGIGTVTLAVIYRLLRSVNHPSLAPLATFLLAVSAFHIRLSRGARMYSLLTFWSLLSLFAFAALLTKSQSQGRASPAREPRSPSTSSSSASSIRGNRLLTWLAFWVVTGLGFFTHYFMAFMLLAQDLFLLVSWRRHRRLLVRWLAIHAVFAAAAAVWAVLSPGLWATLLSLWRRGVASSMNWGAFFSALNGLYLGTTNDPTWHRLVLPLVVTALGLLPFDVGVEGNSHRPDRWPLLLSLSIAVPVITILALPERITARYLTTALPAIILAMSGGLTGSLFFLKNHLPGALRGGLRTTLSYALPSALLCGLLVVSLSTYPTIYTPPGDSFSAKMAYLRGHARPDDGLLLHGPWQELLVSYYDPGSLNTYTMPLRDLKVDVDLAEERLAAIFETHERLWVSYGSVEPVDPGGIVARWLHQHAHQVSSHDGLRLYHRSPAGTPSSAEGAGKEGYEHVESLSRSFGSRLRLESVALSNQVLGSQEAVLIRSEWRALKEIQPGLMMRLELADAKGQVWQDYQFRVGPALGQPAEWGAGDSFVERRGLLVPVGAPPGDYALRVRVFPSPETEWFPGKEEPLEIGSVHVDRSPPPTRVIRSLPGRDLQAAFGEKLTVVGYAPWGRTFTQGNPLLFDVYWQAVDDLEQDYELEISVLATGGEVLAEKRVGTIGGWHPTSRWKAGDVVRGHYAVPLPADASPGQSHVILSVSTPEGATLPVSGTRVQRVLDWWEQERSVSGTSLTLFDARVEEQPHRYRLPATSRRVDIVLETSQGEEEVRLIGYDLDAASVSPGDSVQLTLYWKPLHRLEDIYAVFNHLVTSDGTMLAQQDGWPQRGTYHTNQWLPGEIVDDHYTIEVPPDTSPGDYTLRTGMYHAATGERLVPVANSTPMPGRYIELTELRVRK
jgi:4-amino-4-deoxy-L-arabinose transferase-like glycosyltransferase